jgi:hypothetical protein
MVQELMLEQLPPLTFQKRLMYRTNLNEVQHIYKILNSTIFSNELIMPKFQILPRLRHWGLCYGHYEKPRNSKTYCGIQLMDKWYCKQWLIAVVAHEMCHQYQWDIIGEQRKKKGKDPIMSHGPSFYIFREKLERNYIPLKESFSRARWFKHQNLFRC